MVGDRLYHNPHHLQVLWPKGITLNIDQDLLSRLGIYHQPAPDFGRLRQSILRQGVPDRLPLFEVNIDDEIISPILGEPVQNPGYVNRLAQKASNLTRANSCRYVQRLTRVYYHLGYDYVILPSYLPLASHMVVGTDTAALRRGKGRAWVDESRGPVTTWTEFEDFDWCRVEEIDFFTIEYGAEILPDGMGLVVRARGVMEWLMRLMGFETLCFSLVDDPELVAAVAERVGKLVVEQVHHLTQMSRMNAICIYNDMGFRTNTFISPDQLRQYVLPWIKQYVEATHARGLPFILHACGNLEKIMNDLIEDVGIDAKHSFEDIIMPMPNVKDKYGRQIGFLGGVDMHILATGTLMAVRSATRQAIKDCALGGGYAFGSGNTIANYIPLKNYFAIIDEARRVGWDAN